MVRFADPYPGSIRCFAAATRWVLAFLTAFWVGHSAAEEMAGVGVEPLDDRRPTWRTEIANDVIFDSDNQFTNGWTVQKYSPLGTGVDDLTEVRAFGRGLARWLLPESDGLYYRKGLIIGQNMGTPDDLEDPEIILDDTPYFGLLAAESTWMAFSDERMTGVGLAIGLTGEYSLAEAVQKATHSLFDATDPQGWDNQIDTEPVINAYYMKKRKLWNTPSFDGAISGDVALGNFHTGANVALEMRFGRKPGGFAYVPDPLGRALNYDATFSRGDGRSDSYASLTLRAWGWAVFMPLEGNQFVSDNEWTDNNTIDPERFIGQAIIGYHYVRDDWGLHFSWTLQTDNVDPDSVANGNVDNNFGFISFEWRPSR